MPRLGELLAPVGEALIPAGPEAPEMPLLERPRGDQEPPDGLGEVRREQGGVALLVRQQDHDPGHLHGGPAGAISAHRSGLLVRGTSIGR